MTSTQTRPAQLRSAVIWTAGIAAVWIVAALLRPETTLHLGPLFLPLVPAILLRGDPDALRGVVSGVGLGAVTITVLSLSGNLDGPPLEPFPSALAESIIVLAGAAIIALVVARTGQASRPASKKTV
ncbi:MAG: hypothetical protein GWP18_02545 [Proteobacteria bacterium]|nr:hypothetical protein [Pseudomonadota bacterium]